MTYLNEDEFEEIYKPIQNGLNPEASWGGALYETYGKELEYITSSTVGNNRYIWTLVETTEGERIIPGYHVVNRLGYFVTLKGWDSDQIEVVCESVNDFEGFDVEANWSVCQGSKVYDKVYFMSKDGQVLTIAGTTFEVTKDRVRLDKIAEEMNTASKLQAALIINGKPAKSIYTGKRYVLLKELPDNRAVVAFLPAFSVS